MEHPSLPILYVICEMSSLPERLLSDCPGLSSLRRPSSGIDLLRQGSPCVPGAGKTASIPEVLGCRSQNKHSNAHANAGKTASIPEVLGCRSQNKHSNAHANAGKTASIPEVLGCRSQNKHSNAHANAGKTASIPEVPWLPEPEQALECACKFTVPKPGLGTACRSLMMAG